MIVTYQNIITAPKFVRMLLAVCCLLLIIIWPLSFISVYTRPHPRTAATDWINQNIPAGSVIATEHWDDGLPLGTQGNYRILELPLYDPDTDFKWQKINQKLSQAEYIILASNRLYVPLQKLTDCLHLPPGRCYTRTAQYYQELFSTELGFEKLIEFTSFPTIPFTSYIINDQPADESFTVYDHPKVIIFKKT